MMPKVNRSCDSLEGYRSVRQDVGVGLAKALDELSSPAKRETSCNRYSLKRRELEIIRRLATGGTNKMIASDLAISRQDVRRHIADLFERLGVSTQLELVLFAVYHQLIDRPGFD